MAALGPVLPCPFGRYTLVERVGAGGMATVYRALLGGEGGFEKEVAVKVVREELAHEPQFRTLFLDEARLSARLAHANLVQTFDFGQVEGTWFLAMEYVRGRTLANLLRALRTKNLWPGVARSVSLAAEVAKGLGHAHRLAAPDGTPLGLVHRDVSPQNVLVSTEGDVKLGDFGIAKAALSSHVTQPGRVRGKCAYMAPEQARGRTVDARADVFALGVVLWECLAGTALFDGGSDGEILLQVLQKEVVPPSRLRPEVPPEVDAVVLRMLAREPAARPGNGDEAARELAGLRLRLAHTAADLDLGELDRLLRSGTAVQPSAAPWGSVELPLPVTGGAGAGAPGAGTAPAPAMAAAAPKVDGSASPNARGATAILPPASPPAAAAATARPPGSDPTAPAAPAPSATAPTVTAPTAAGPGTGGGASGLPTAAGPATRGGSRDPREVFAAAATPSAPSPDRVAGARSRANGRRWRSGAVVLASAAFGVALGVAGLAAFPERNPAAAADDPLANTAGSELPATAAGELASPTAAADAPASRGAAAGPAAARETARDPARAPGAPVPAAPPDPVARPAEVPLGAAPAPASHPDPSALHASRSVAASTSGSAGPRRSADAPAARPSVGAADRQPLPTSVVPSPGPVDREPSVVSTEAAATAAQLVVTSVLVADELDVRIDGAGSHPLRKGRPVSLLLPPSRRRVTFASTGRACAVTVELAAGAKTALLQGEDGAVHRLEGTRKQRLPCE